MSLQDHVGWWRIRWFLVGTPVAQAPRRRMSMRAGCERRAERGFLRMQAIKAVGVLVGGLLLAPGCTGDDAESDDEDFTSAQATLLEFEFDGELETSDTWDLRQTI